MRVMLDHHPAIRMAYQRPVLFNSKSFHYFTWRVLPAQGLIRCFLDEARIIEMTE
jgi:hypothetical protein